MIHVFFPPQWSSWLLFLSIGLKNTAISVCPFFVVVWKVCYWIHKSVFLFTGIILKTVNYCFWFDLDNTKHLQQITYNQKKPPTLPQSFMQHMMIYIKHKFHFLFSPLHPPHPYLGFMFCIVSHFCVVKWKLLRWKHRWVWDTSMASQL